MNSFKSFALSALAAAGTLLFVAVSTPAQACAGCTIKLNGPVFQGPVLQGPILQGPVLQGPIATGAPAARFTAVSLPSGETIPLR